MSAFAACKLHAVQDVLGVTSSGCPNAERAFSKLFVIHVHQFRSSLVVNRNVGDLISIVFEGHSSGICAACAHIEDVLQTVLNLFVNDLFDLLQVFREFCKIFKRHGSFLSKNVLMNQLRYQYSI